MNRYMFLYHGVTPETYEIVAYWHSSLVGQVAEKGSPFTGGREVSQERFTQFDMSDAEFTGYSIMVADDLDHATAIARTCPSGIRITIYEEAANSGTIRTLQSIG